MDYAGKLLQSSDNITLSSPGSARAAPGVMHSKLLQSFFNQKKQILQSNELVDKFELLNNNAKKLSHWVQKPIVIYIKLTN